MSAADQDLSEITLNQSVSSRNNANSTPFDVTNLTSMEGWVSFPYGIHGNAADALQARTELLGRAIETIASKQDEILRLLREDTATKKRASPGEGKRHQNNRSTKRFKSDGKTSDILGFNKKELENIIKFTGKFIANGGKMLSRRTSTSNKGSLLWFKFVEKHLKKNEKFDSFKDDEKEDLYLEIGKLIKYEKTKGERQDNGEEEEEEEENE
ncbi:hypothetical protein BPAE_0528g00040 [Botrytis paeoniae]|uniref:Uncharacterized protein n=1 Tax=Botrytis paeoniae TaxID=278948 RepID=A0A4Z1EZV9_9HELO|nr:hypothetical protein BPAE_0528g00040 [Botrytis paeoniae]